MLSEVFSAVHVRGLVPRALFLISSTSLSLCCLVGCTSPNTVPVDCAGCNFLFISVDTVRPDHTSLYRGARSTTPSLRRFFAGGAVLDNATTPSPCTFIAVKQFLTGDFDQETQRFAQVLQKNDYDTAAVVSQHIFRWWGGIQQFRVGFRHWDIQGEAEVDHHGMSLRTATEVSDRAIAWLQQRTDERPFFLWLHYFDPHDPYNPPREHRRWAAEDGRYPEGDRRRALKEKRLDKSSNWHTAGAIFSSSDVEHLVGLYDGEIEYSDYEINRVLEELRERGELERTLVVFTSDHGENLGENDVWDHCFSVREAELRVPLAINVPASAFAMAKGAAVSTLDIFPTVLEILHVEYDPAGLEGRSLLAKTPRRAISMFKDVITVRSDTVKLLVAKAQKGYRPIALYDVGVDFYEKRNLLAERPAERERLLESLADFFENIGERARLDKQTLEKLRALGYTE